MKPSPKSELAFDVHEGTTTLPAYEYRRASRYTISQLNAVASVVVCQSVPPSQESQGCVLSNSGWESGIHGLPEGLIHGDDAIWDDMR